LPRSTARSPNAPHLIEETVRHNGPLDHSRELADGVTGV
jgi:hypothetical protein